MHALILHKITERLAAEPILNPVFVAKEDLDRELATAGRPQVFILDSGDTPFDFEEAANDEDKISLEIRVLSEDRTEWFSETGLFFADTVFNLLLGFEPDDMCNSIAVESMEPGQRTALGLNQVIIKANVNYFNL